MTPDVAILFPILTGDTVNAIANRLNEPEPQRRQRAEAAREAIVAHNPGDGMEIMLASKAVMYEAMALDAVNDMSRATTEDNKHRDRQQSIALGRLHMAFLKELKAHRLDIARREKAAARAEAAKRAAARPAEPNSETIIMPAAKAPPPPIQTAPGPVSATVAPGNAAPYPRATPQPPVQTSVQPRAGQMPPLAASTTSRPAAAMAGR